MKKFALTFAAVMVPLDYLALLIAGTLAYFLRFGSFVTEIRPVIFNLSYFDFFKILAVASLAWLLVFALNGLYTLKRRNFSEETLKIFVASSTATLLIVVAFFFNFQLFSSRLIILTGWLLSIIVVILERLLVSKIKKIFYRKGVGLLQVAVIGKSKNAEVIANEFAKHQDWGTKLAGKYLNFSEEVIAILNTKVKAGEIDEIVLADADLTTDEKNKVIDFCLANQLNYRYAASILETNLVNFELSAVAGVPLIGVKQTRLEGWGRIIKRFFDLVGSFFLIIICSPLMIFTALLVLCTSKGPILVKLDRVGYGGKHFKLLKFRSMVKDADKMKEQLIAFNERADGPLFKMTNDPRLTSIGGFIRKWSLDEFAQLFNVFAGNMSLVGPRPHEPQEVAKYQVQHKKLLVLKPGITGFAQVSGRSDLLWADEVRLDIYYVENWSFSFDLQILLKTPRAVFGRRKAV